MVGYRGGCVLDGGGDLSDVSERLSVHDGVETVVGVGGVLNSTLEAVGVDQGVGAVHDISIAALVLALGVTRVSVLHVVREAVLGVGVVRLDLGDGGGVRCRGSDLGYGSCGVVGRSGLDGVAGVGNRS